MSYYLLYKNRHWNSETGPHILGPFLTRDQVEAFCQVMPEYTQAACQKGEDFLPVAWVERCAWGPEEIELGESPWVDVHPRRFTDAIAKAEERLAKERENDQRGTCYVRFVNGAFVNDNLLAAEASLAECRLRARSAEKVVQVLADAGIPGKDEQDAWYAWWDSQAEAREQAHELAAESMRHAAKLANQYRIFE